MKTFVMCKGLPASGKTTWATQQVLNAEPGKAVRVNMDLLRVMLNADRFKGQRTEGIITAGRDKLISLAMMRDVPLVLSDDTNLNPKCEEAFRQICEVFGYTFTIQDFTDVEVNECIRRDLKRPNSVGHKVIRRMYHQYCAPRYLPPTFDPSKPTAVVVDIDGTLAHMNERSPYDLTKVGEDLVDEVVAFLVGRARDYGDRIIVCSGRENVCSAETKAWLSDHDVKYDDLFMREAGDNRDDAIVKGEIYEQLIQPHYNVRYVLDDRDRVVAMWRARGLKVLQVAEGDF